MRERERVGIDDRQCFFCFFWGSGGGGHIFNLCISVVDEQLGYFQGNKGYHRKKEARVYIVVQEIRQSPLGTMRKSGALNTDIYLCWRTWETKRREIVISRVIRVNVKIRQILKEVKGKIRIK